MINYADKMAMEARLMTNLADWIGKHGTVISDRQRSNAYCGVRTRKIDWRGNRYEVVEVDGMTCQINRIK